MEKIKDPIFSLGEKLLGHLHQASGVGVILCPLYINDDFTLSKEAAKATKSKDHIRVPLPAQSRHRVPSPIYGRREQGPSLCAIVSSMAASRSMAHHIDGGEGDGFGVDGVIFASSIFSGIWRRAAAGWGLPI
ncbi:hypothetical protein U1Q18_028279 [Sarracenia purpurea var. burkii]